MFRTKFAKGFIIGLGLAMALSSAVYAEKAPEEEFTIQITGAEAGELPPDMPVSSDDQIYLKQLEADRYLFADHADEIAARGITVTHTVPTDDYVEIGITPYNEENADFIYQVLGKDRIKVVEGIQAITFNTGAAADGREIYNAELYSEDAKTVSAPVEDQVVSITADAVSAPADPAVSAAALTAAIAVASIILAGGILLTARRMKAAKR